MKEYKDIDRLFQEKFRDFEETPSNKVWKNIKNSITDRPKTDRKAIWLWFSGVAAGLALLFFMNQTFYTPLTPEQETTETNKLINIKNNPTDSEITATPTHEKTVDKQHQKLPNRTIKTKIVATTQTTSNSKQTKPSSQISKQNLKNTALATTQRKEIPSTKTLPKITNTISEIIIKTPIDELLEEKVKIAQTDHTSQEKETHQLEKQLNNTISESINNEELTEETVEVEKSNKKWSISTLVAPVYLSAFDKKTSSIDSQFDNNVKQGNFSAAYGVQVAYQLNNRFSLQSGLHVVDYGYKTYGVYVSPSGAVSRYSNINYNGDANLVNVSALPSVAQPNALNETTIQESKGDLTQVFGYIEIPIEAKYRLNKGNLGINVIGGFSTLLLNKNEIFIETVDFSNKLGEASNLNSLNFSGNIGLELEYKLYKNINFNLIPMFKVHTSTFENNTGGFSPYTIGVYSGLNLRF